MASIILKRGDDRVQPHPLADLLTSRADARPADEAASQPAAAEVGEPPAAPEAHEKSVEVLRQGGVATAVEVRCTCGEVTVIEFDYAAEPAAPAQPDVQPEEGTSTS